MLLCLCVCVDADVDVWLLISGRIVGIGRHVLHQDSAHLCTLAGFSIINRAVAIENQFCLGNKLKLHISGLFID